MVEPHERWRGILSDISPTMDTIDLDPDETIPERIYFRFSTADTQPLPEVTSVQTAKTGQAHSSKVGHLRHAICCDVSRLLGAKTNDAEAMVVNSLPADTLKLE